MKSKIVLSFDDGRVDNYQIATDVLLPRYLKATFNITTAYLNGGILSNNRPCVNPPMQISELKELASHHEFEIAGHGNNHSNTIADWKEGIQILKDWLGEQWYTEGIGIASPHSKISNQDILKLEKVLKEMNVIYIRTGLANQSCLVQRVISRLARVTGSEIGFVLPIENSLQTIGHQVYIHSIPILHQHSLRQLTYLIDKCIEKKKDCVFMFHSIIKPNEKFYDSLWSWDYYKFLKLCDYLVELRNRNLIDIITTREAFGKREKN